MEAPKLLLVLVAALLAAGCVDPSDTPSTATPTTASSASPAACAPVAPKSGTVTGLDQSAASDNPGAFGDSGQMAGVTGTKEFAWQDASGAAMVAWGGQSASGSFKLTILDACGQQVFQQSYDAPSQGGANQNTKPGTPGAWLIRLEYTAYTGQMGLSVTG